MSVNLEPEAVQVGPSLDDLEPTTDRNAIINAISLNERTVNKGDLETGIFRSKTGVVLQLVRPNPHLVDKALERFKVPDVPEVYDEEYEANKPNPDDPGYVQAVAKYQQDTVMLITDIYTSHIEVLECPEKLSPVHDDAWEDDVTMFGIEVPERGKARLLAWLNFYALDEDEFAELVSFTFMFNARIREEDVRARIDSFRNNEELDTDSGTSTESEQSTS